LQRRNEAQELTLVALVVFGPPIGLWWAWTDAPPAAHGPLFAGVVAGAILLVAYAFVDRARRGSFFIRDPREVERRRERSRRMLPLYVGAAVLLVALRFLISTEIERAGVGFLIGVIGAAAPFLVANYLRLRRESGA
jgi:hypothetical protein